jgi:lipid II isoglutaminyl synthase (glutamine-hydrolysing)
LSPALTVATLFPLATVAAADEANAAALVRRGAARDLTVETVTVDRADSFVDADVYLVGGTGRAGVGALVEALGSTDLAARVADGAVLFAVDAGLDAVARSWVDASGGRHKGLGLAPVTVHAASESTGTVVTQPDPSLDLPALVGWEDNDLRTVREDGARPLFTLEIGAGNRTDEPDGAAAEGVLAGSVMGTRLHGPLLALNLELADLVLARATGRDEPWTTLQSGSVERARRERIAETRRGAPRTDWRRRLPKSLAARLRG